MYYIPECDCFACKNLKRSTTNRYSSITLKLEQLLEINLPRWQTQVEWTSCSPVLLSTAGQEEAAHARNCARIFRNKITLHGCTKCNKIVMLQNQVIHNAPFPALTLLWEFLLEWNLGVSLFYIQFKISSRYFNVLSEKPPHSLRRWMHNKKTRKWI